MHATPITMADLDAALTGPASPVRIAAQPAPLPPAPALEVLDAMTDADLLMSLPDCELEPVSLVLLERLTLRMLGDEQPATRRTVH